MFDTIYSDAVRCPLCGRSLEWQSKDGPCLFERLTTDYQEAPSFRAGRNGSP